MRLHVDAILNQKSIAMQPTSRKVVLVQTAMTARILGCLWETWKLLDEMRFESQSKLYSALHMLAYDVDMQMFASSSSSSKISIEIDISMRMPMV